MTHSELPEGTVCRFSLADASWSPSAEIGSEKKFLKRSLTDGSAFEVRKRANTKKMCRNRMVMEKIVAVSCVMQGVLEIGGNSVRPGQNDVMETRSCPRRNLKSIRWTVTEIGKNPENLEKVDSLTGGREWRSMDYWFIVFTI